MISVNNNYSTSFGCIHRPKKKVSKKQVLAGAASVAAITAGVVYKKPTMKFFKEFSLKNSIKNTKNAFDKFTGKAQKEKRYATVSKENVQKAVHRDYLKNLDTDFISLTKDERELAIRDARAAFETHSSK